MTVTWAAPCSQCDKLRAGGVLLFQTWWWSWCLFHFHSGINTCY